MYRDTTNELKKDANESSDPSYEPIFDLVGDETRRATCAAVEIELSPVIFQTGGAAVPRIRIYMRAAYRCTYVHTYVRTHGARRSNTREIRSCRCD